MKKLFILVTIAIALFTACEKKGGDEPKDTSYPYLCVDDLAPLHRVHILDAESKLQTMGYTGGKEITSKDVYYVYDNSAHTDTIVLSCTADNLVDEVDYSSYKRVLPADAKPWLSHPGKNFNLLNWSNPISFDYGYREKTDYMTKDYDLYQQILNDLGTDDGITALWASDNENSACHVILMYSCYATTTYAQLSISSYLEDK